ncbi:MAG: SWIM zinc finger family protein [Moraxellaceae bacterium]
MWKTEQIIALAPDSSSEKNGRALANAAKWLTRGRSENAVWGECQGSGKNPYQTAIDLREPAFKCSCPSRKFPCKHALGLFLLFAAQENLFALENPPAFCGEWLEKRDAGKEKKEAQADSEITAEEKEKREKSRAKRAFEREKKVAEGLRELEKKIANKLRQSITGSPNRATRNNRHGVRAFGLDSLRCFWRFRRS